MNRFKVLLTAISIAFAFTLPISCSSGGDDGGGDPSSSSGGNGGGGSSSSGGGSSLDYGTLTYEGQTYKTIKIGEQIWMAENLNYDEGGGSKCYDNAPANCVKYGRLYDWATANTVCPPGWHLPDNDDWDALYRFADGNSGTSNPHYDSPTAGKHLKSASGWERPGPGSFGGLDTHGFSALPGGRGDRYNSERAGDIGYWWSASEAEYDARSNACGRVMYYHNERASWFNDLKSQQFSVRCLQD